MEGEIVLYDGRNVPKQGFRVFIYSFDNQTKLVESWEEYQENLASGIWFSHLSDPRLQKNQEPDVRDDRKKGRK